MWTKQQTPPETAPSSNLPSSGSSVAPSRAASSASRPSARLGSGLRVKGEITGSEDLQVDGLVEGPISIGGHMLTVGSTAQLNSEVHAGEVVVSGKLVGDVHANGRVEITKDGSIIGDIACARISIEDGAHFKGRIEIDPARSKHAN